MTLIELVVAITIVAIAAAAVLGTLTAIGSRSAETLVRQQAASIASAYLNEVLQKSYADPDAIPVEPARNLFDDIFDYAGLTNVGARDQFDRPIPNLDQFTVTVQVTSPGASVFPNVAAAEVRRVDVTATHSSGVSVTLSGYRARY